MRLQPRVAGELALQERRQQQQQPQSGVRTAAVHCCSWGSVLVGCYCLADTLRSCDVTGCCQLLLLGLPLLRIAAHLEGAGVPREHIFRIHVHLLVHCWIRHGHHDSTCVPATRGEANKGLASAPLMCMAC